MHPERRRLALALLLSLLIHALLVSLSLGGQGLGLPGLSFPWQQRRGEVPDLHIVLVPAPAPPAEPLVAPPAVCRLSPWSRLSRRPDRRRRSCRNPRSRPSRRLRHRRAV